MAVRYRPFIGRIGAIALACVLVLSGCGSGSGSGGGGSNGGGGGTNGGGGGGTNGGGTDTSSNPPPLSYVALIDPTTLPCPYGDVEYTSSAPDRWRVCGVASGQAGVLINLSDDVEVFAAPSDVSVSARRTDTTTQAIIIRNTLTELSDAVAAGSVSDPAVPNGQYRFAYALPGGSFGFAGARESVSRTMAATSLLATVEVAIARTVEVSAASAVSTGAVRPTQSPAQFLLGLSNPISSCAQAGITFIGQPNSQTTTLTELVSNTITGGKSCKSAIELFSVSEADEDLRVATDSTLAFRAKTIGRHALADKSFLQDFGTLLLTGLEHR